MILIYLAFFAIELFQVQAQWVQPGGTYNITATHQVLFYPALLNCDPQCAPAVANGNYCVGYSQNCAACQSQYYAIDPNLLVSGDARCNPSDSPFGFYISAQTIYKCLSQCYSCGSGSQCNDCLQDYVFDSTVSACKTSCASGSYPSQQSGQGVGGVCKACPVGCTFCLNQNVCLQCSSSTQRPSYEYDSVNLIQQYLCKSATDKVNFFLQNDFLYPTSALQSTPIYEQCDNECNGCSGGSYLCTGCQSQYSPSSTTSSTFFCIQSCNDSFYFVNQGGQMTCQPCSDSCQMCTSATSCSLCATGYYKQKNLNGSVTCVSTCTAGYYPDQIQLTCLQCDPSCATCFGATSYTCTTCSTQYKKVGKNQCIKPVCGDGIITPEVEQCDDGNTNNKDGCNSACQIEQGWKCCIASDPVSSNWLCSTNQSQANLNSLMNLINYTSKCSTVCGDGFRIGPSLGGTENCDSQGQPGCDSHCQIMNGYSCTGGNATTPDVCTYLCSANCVICQTNYQNNTVTGTCIQCASGYFAYKDSCYSQCPQNLYNDLTTGTGFCVTSCPSNAFISKTNCVDSCEQSEFISENYCLTSCLPGTYLDTATNTCAICHFSCSTCTGGLNTNCTACNTGYKSINLGNSQYECMLQCKNGYVQDPQNSMQCMVCQQNCDKCISIYYQFNDDCVIACPEGTFQNTDSMTCDKFQNPQVSFTYSPAITNGIIGINQDYQVTANIQSVYPIISMQWSVVNQNPVFLQGLNLNTNTIIVRKENLDYNMKITLQFVAESSKGLTTQFVNLATYSKPVIPIYFLVNGSQSKTLIHMSDVLTIQTKYWPTSTLLNYSIYCVGLKTGTIINIDSGSSSTDLAIKFIFPFLQVSETYTVIINLQNSNLQLSITDSLNVLANSIPVRPLDQIFGRAFNLNSLTNQQLDTMVYSVTNQYSKQLTNNTNFLNSLMNGIFLNQTFGVPLNCKNVQFCGQYGTCNDTVAIKCSCNAGYSGQFCSYTSDQFTQIQSLGPIIQNAMNLKPLSEQEYLKVGLNLTNQTDIGEGIFNAIGSALPQYLNNIANDDLLTNYGQYVNLIGQIIDEQPVLNSTSQADLDLFKSVFTNFQSLNQKRMSLLTTNNPFFAINYGTNLYTFLSTQQVSAITNPIELMTSTNWALSNTSSSSSSSSSSSTNGRYRQLQVINSNNIVYNITSVLQTNLIEAEVSIPVKVIKNSGVTQVLLAMHRWQFNPRQSFVSDQTVNQKIIANLETPFIEVQSNIDSKYILQNDNTTYILYKLPRMRQQQDDSTTLLLDNPFSCYSFDSNTLNWNNSTCLFVEETYYYIYCSCPTINTVFFASRNFQIFSEITSESLRALISKLVTNSGLWMSVVIVLLFLFCWLGTKDTHDPDYVDKRSFRRLTPILSIFFVRYPLKPVRFRILQVSITIFTQMLIESGCYLLLGSNFTSDAIPNYGVYGVLISIPFNYIFGQFAKWAQFSASEEELMLEIEYEKSQGRQVGLYHIVENQEQSEMIKKQYENKQTLRQQISMNTKLKKYSQINKNAQDQSHQKQGSSYSEKNHSFNSINQQSGKESDTTSHQQPKILVMKSDLISSRVFIFQIISILVAVGEAVLTILFIVLNDNDNATNYFIGSVIVGFFLDFIFLDLSVALAAKYIKIVFKVISKRGIWFKMPKDIRAKQENQYPQNDNHSEKSSVTSKVQSGINFTKPNEELSQQDIQSNVNIRNQDKNINLFIDKSNEIEDEEQEEVDEAHQMDQYHHNTSEDKSSQSNHNF